MKKYLIATLLLPLPLNAALVECWTFNDLAAGGLSGNGTEVSFGINGSPAVIRGAGASATGSSIDLPGGSSATAAYIDLPNGIISNKSSITLSTWVTISSTTSPWQRIFDFGSTDTGVGSQGGELFGPGGGGAGTEYIILAPAQGNNPNAQRLEYRESNTTFNTTDSGISTPIGSEHLFTFVWEDMGGGLARQGWYLDGSLVTMSGNFAGSLSAINDVNNWLGRSNWTVDGNTDGTFNQFALYDHAMTGAEVLAEFAAGPSHIPESSTSIFAAGAVLGLAFRRRRA